MCAHIPIKYGTYYFSNVWTLTISSTRGWQAIGNFGKIRSNWHVPTKNYRWLPVFEVKHPTELSKHIFSTYSGTGGSSVSMATIYGLKCDHKRKPMSQPTTICVHFLVNLLEQCLIYDEIKHVLNENMAQNKSGMFTIVENAFIVQVYLRKCPWALSTCTPTTLHEWYNFVSGNFLKWPSWKSNLDPVLIDIKSKCVFYTYVLRVKQIKWNHF